MTKPGSPDGRIPFLAAEWRHLVMLNWSVPPQLLAPLVPGGTALDTWNGTHYLSLVGFLFLRTRLFGVPIPFHRDFEEVNLRFYVRRTAGSEVRRGVCFVRELVPRTAIALTARLFYNEPYRAVPMSHSIVPAASAGDAESVTYRWRTRNQWSRIVAHPTGDGSIPAPGSHEEFITEHYWGYTRQRSGGTVEYNVVHPPWRVRSVPAPVVEGDLASIYGKAFAAIMAQPPDSAFLADGSRVTVYFPATLRDVSPSTGSDVP